MTCADLTCARPTLHPNIEEKAMKSAITLLATATLLLAGPLAFADRDLTEAEVPAAVIQAFKAAYPNATEAKFEEETEKGLKTYEVEFKLDGKKFEVDYSDDGKPLKVEQDD
jgi:hypothetical protein